MSPAVRFAIVTPPWAFVAAIAVSTVDRSFWLVFEGQDKPVCRAAPATASTVSHIFAFMASDILPWSRRTARASSSSLRRRRAAAAGATAPTTAFEAEMEPWT